MVRRAGSVRCWPAQFAVTAAGAVALLAGLAGCGQGSSPSATPGPRSGEPVSRVVQTLSFETAIMGLAFDRVARAVYAPDNNDSTVMVIDTTTGDVVDTITVGPAPLAVVVDETAGTVYVANSHPDTGANGTVSVIDTTTGDVVDTITVGRDPFSMALDAAAGLPYVTNSDLNSETFPPADATVSVIDTTTRDLVDSITVGASPLGVAVDGDAGVVYVAHMDWSPGSEGGKVSVVDAASREVIDTITVGALPGPIVVDPDTGTVFVVNAWDGTISVLAVE